MGNCCRTRAAATALDIKISIRKDPALMAITEKFLLSVIPAENCLADLRSCLELAHFRLEPIHDAVILFEKNKKKKKKKKMPRLWQSMMMKLQEFEMNSGNAFDSLNSQLTLGQLEMLTVELRRLKEETRAGIRSTQWWRRVWTIAFTAVFVSVLACSVALAAFAVLPMLAISAAAAIATALKAVPELGINHLFDEREKKLEEKKEVLEVLRGCGFSLSKVESVLAVAEKLRVNYGTLQEEVKFVLREQDDENAVEVGMAAIKKKLDINEGGIRDDIECLKRKVEGLIADIGRLEDELHKYIRD